MNSLMDSSDYYNEAGILYEKLDFDSARVLFEKSLALCDHPITALRVQQCFFAEGDFDNIVLPEPSSSLIDGWIRLGIFVSVLHPRPGLDLWLASSIKNATSGRTVSFLAACQAEGLVPQEFPVPQAKLQEVQKVRKMIQSRKYWNLLNGNL